MNVILIELMHNETKGVLCLLTQPNTHLHNDFKELYGCVLHYEPVFFVYFFLVFLLRKEMLCLPKCNTLLLVVFV